MLKKITKKYLLEMKLHEVEDVNNDCSVFRVVGGWIYQFATKGAFIFVPEVQDYAKPDYEGVTKRQIRESIEGFYFS